MPPSLFGLAAATLLAALWMVTRRRPRPLLRSLDTSAVAALNRAQLRRQTPLPLPLPASVASGPPAPPEAAAASTPAIDPAALRRPRPAGGRESQQLRARLAVAARGPLPGRIEAMRTARRWGHRSVLPLLRLGLRDVHPEVVREAALALEAYRGRSTAASTPRRVVRTR
jgi:hypothetical protein